MVSRRFQTRVVVSFLALITFVQVGSLIAVNSEIERSAHAWVKDELATAAKVVGRLIDARTQRLTQAARIVSADFPFKQVVALDDPATLLSAMDNHRVRLGADLMMVVSLDTTRVIDTLHRRPASTASDPWTAVPRLIEAAKRTGEAADFTIVDGQPYQVVVVPVLAPAPIAWICMGFLIDPPLAHELATTTAAQVSFVQMGADGGWSSVASTLAPDARRSLFDALARRGRGSDERGWFDAASRERDTLVIALPSSTGARVDVVLQRSLADAMAPYRHLRTALLGLFAVAAGISIVGGVWIARGVSRPVRQLADAARGIEAGTYGGAVAMTRADELGELAASFNRMTSAVAEREERLRESEARFRAMTESAVDAVVSVDAGGRVVSWNRGAERMFGAAAAEALLTPLERWIPGHADEALARVRTPGATSASPAPIEGHGLRQDGRRVPIELSVATWATREGTFATAIIRDVTERTQLEEQFRQAQKMDSIGRLAGGVAHDFNNLLTIIGGHTALLRLQLANDPSALEKIGLVQEAAARAADLTRQLLVFSRKQVLEPRILDLNAVITRVEPMLRRLIGEDVELVARPATDLGRVEADPGQITQIIVNLAVNARDAMPGGGHLTIETANVELDDVFAHLHAEVRPSPYVMLAVTDTGVGMSEEVRSHVFEPFFTTKEPGKGTGLGLATVYGIVKQSNGNIGVYSEPGRGTTFKIYLPRVERPADPVGPEATAAGQRGTETILLVEDDEKVRALAGEVLKGHGYTVLEARHGEDAIDIAQRYHGAIHLLLTDVVMPRMGGPELAARLHPGRPAMKVLFMSGYTADTIVRHGVLDDGTAFLSKPLMPATLAAKVRETLDGR